MAGVTVDLKQVIKGLEKEKRNAEKILKYTVSDFRTRAPGWVSAAVREQYNIKHKDVKAAYKGATNNGSVSLGGGTVIDNVSLKWSGHSLTPTHFEMTPEEPPELPKGGPRILVPNEYLNVKEKGPKQVAAWTRIPKKYSVSDKVFKSQRKAISGKYNTPIFIASVRGQKPLAFQRLPGSDRNKFVSLKSISVPQMIEDGKGNLKGNVQKVINENLEKRFKTHCDTYLGK